MALDLIRAANRHHHFTDERVGELRFHEPTARQALGWSFKLMEISKVLATKAEGEKLSQDDIEEVLNTQLDVLTECFISCYLPDHTDDAASERDAWVAFRLTGGWRDGTLAVFLSRLISGGTGLPELEGLPDEEVAAAEDFTAPSTEPGQ